jgi:hypothetical protein
MLKRVGPLSWVLVAALCPQLAAAQVNYKSTMPDGRVIYGDKPAPGARKVEPLKSAPTKGVTVSTPRDAAALKQLETARTGRAVSSATVSAAEQALRKAEAELAAGKEPGEGDRIGTASGAQRFSDAYWARQKRLAENYDKARANLEKVQRDVEAQNAARAARSGTTSTTSTTITPGTGSQRVPRGE